MTCNQDYGLGEFKLTPAAHMAPEHGAPARIRTEPGAKRIRAYLGGELVADTIHPLLVWEGPHYPAYYFPVEDVRRELLAPDGGRAHSPSRGDGVTFTVAAGGRQAPGGALSYEVSPVEQLRGLIRLDWDAMDAWFEEDEEIFTHPRDPYTRVDMLPAQATSALSSTASRSPSPTARTSCSRRACRCATTCRSPTCAWTCSS